MTYDTLHTPEQKRAKLRGLVEGVRMLKLDFDSGALKDEYMLKHDIECLLQLAEEAYKCIDSL